MEESTDLIKLRRDKVAEFREKGINPYINRFKINAFLGDLTRQYIAFAKEELEAEPREFIVAGRIMTRRKHGKTTFCNIKDGTG